MTEQKKAQRLALYWTMKNDQGEYLQSSLNLREETAAELRRLDANEAELVGALQAAANYIDTLGGVSNHYRQLITRIEAERNAK